MDAFEGTGIGHLAGGRTRLERRKPAYDCMGVSHAPGPALTVVILISLI